MKTPAESKATPIPEQDPSSIKATPKPNTVSSGDMFERYIPPLEAALENNTSSYKGDILLHLANFKKAQAKFEQDVEQQRAQVAQNQQTFREQIATQKEQWNEQRAEIKQKFSTASVLLSFFGAMSIVHLVTYV